MKFIIILTFFFFSNLNGLISSHQTSDNDPILYIYVDELPRLNYDGGLKKYISDNIQWPDQICGGFILVSFVVHTNGKVEDLKIEKNSCPPQCYEEVKRIFESIPDWEPGKLDSREVDVKLYLPFEFKISN